MTSNAWPTDPRALLEKRYAAFTEANIDFILESHHPDTRAEANRETLLQWAKESTWLGLDIESVEEKGDRAVIRFSVKYSQKAEILTQKEDAEFRKLDGRWYYFDSVFTKPATYRRETEKVGRNDPCTCGSGKKLKKCHGQ